MKILKRIIALIISAFAVLGLAACKIDIGDFSTSESSSKDTTGKTEILISVYAAGYGQGWIDKACEIYEREHPEYVFKIRANSRMFETVTTELTSGTCNSDIVLLAGYDYLNIATSGKLVELSSVYSSNIPGTETKVKDAVSKEQYEYRLIGENKDQIYGIPWQDATANGFVYNKKMFRDNNWTVPTTMDEFFALCDKIAADTNVAPLVYGGGQQNAYQSMTPHHWIVQYYGYEYMQNTFEKYLSPEQYNYTSAGRLKAYETLARMLKGTTANGENIALNGSNAFTAQGAQREFIQGKAAMVTCGPWFPTEMRALLVDYPDFEFGYIPLPHINADKKDVNGNDTSNVGYSLAANLLAIPASSKNVAVAKDFLASMFTSESYTSFVNENNGITRPINVEVNESVLGDFAKDVYASLSGSKKNGTCVYETSLAPISVNGYLGICNFSGSDAILNIINSSSYSAAKGIAATASKADYEIALSFWDNKKGAWKEEYIGIK